MLYLLAIVLPPVAVLLIGRPIQALLNLGLCLLLFVPGVIHAILVVNEHKADKRMKKQVKYQFEFNQKQQRKMTKEEIKDMERQFREQEREDEREWKRENM